MSSPHVPATSQGGWHDQSVIGSPRRQARCYVESFRITCTPKTLSRRATRSAGVISRIARTLASFGRMVPSKNFNARLCQLGIMDNFSFQDVHIRRVHRPTSIPTALTSEIQSLIGMFVSSCSSSSIVAGGGIGLNTTAAVSAVLQPALDTNHQSNQG